ncbi:Bleomycin hydrolase-like protein [Reticulomyxa filosa]|uniref:Bleomycin hydrolase-like protein n=1 Tax=Reticulomyxa filosa TaxID=46433 RepID=X6PD93_RETFI|nr:Bleomycin hydrolase-like protein [Reticulomyxa filosa]|eukprot:ETO35647.1 Bleomycin hydrolase-like protein [Reticulomyxa filosa]
MVVNLVEKYGLVPKDVFPEAAATKVKQTTTKNSCQRLNGILNSKLREFACNIRSYHEKHKKYDVNRLREMKKEHLKEIYRILVITFGVPPKSFSWAYRDKVFEAFFHFCVDVVFFLLICTFCDDKEYHRINDVTPLEFYNYYVRKHLNVSDTVSLINDPRNEYFKTYTIDRLNNIEGGKRPNVLYINMPIETLKEQALTALRDNIPVWFGCQVGKEYNSEKGILDVKQFDYELLFDTEFTMTKAQRLLYGDSLMTHAMVFTGVELDNDLKPVRWRVENSHGEKGNKGYILMTDEWFDEHVYQLVVDKNRLPKDVIDTLSQKPVVLPPWDPMGSLAL